MINDLVGDLYLLRKADSLIGRIWLRFIARQFGLLVFAALIAAFGLAMISVAAFYTLQALVAPGGAATIVAIADFVLAGIVIAVARNSEPGPEIDQALDIRKKTIESLQADAHDLQVSITALGQEIRDAKDSIVGFVQDPVDAAVQKLLIPAAKSIIEGLRSKKGQASEK
ncbi:MAG TPA: phage holin family protein [Candidatus Margulisiibacteriota bacterium]|nr:phage holin family protein [Candidatus Margulisiibacteriota bacterium]HVP34242.1 phage holin family protein [Steroidobacteraceae bacterium]